MGFGGTKFLATLKAMYTGDNVTCKVAGVTTRPVYLTRGLRQVSLLKYDHLSTVKGVLALAYAVRPVYCRDGAGPGRIRARGEALQGGDLGNLLCGKETELPRN